MSRRKIKVIIPPKPKSKAKRALSATGGFFHKVGTSISLGFKTGVTKGIVPVGKATGSFFKNSAVTTKNATTDFLKSRRITREIKATQQKAESLAKTIIATAGRENAVQVLQNLHTKTIDNQKTIEAAILKLQEEVDNDISKTT